MQYVTYLVFDAPSRSEKGMKYEERVAWMEENIKPQSETTYAAVVGVCKCTGKDHLAKVSNSDPTEPGSHVTQPAVISQLTHSLTHSLSLSLSLCVCFALAPLRSDAEASVDERR